MSRREYRIGLACAEMGCPERSFTVAETREEERAIRVRYAKTPWRCTRHTAPDQVLTPTNREREHVLEAMFGDGPYINDTLFWGLPGGRATNGFVFGPGFKAFAKDFPPGTRLVVTARIELPDEPAAP